MSKEYLMKPQTNIYERVTLEIRQDSIRLTVCRIDSTQSFKQILIPLSLPTFEVKCLTVLSLGRAQLIAT